MPISVGDISWTQDEAYVRLKIIPKETVPLTNLDIFTHYNYIKLNCPPRYYQELFLYKHINDEQSSCKIFGREINFQLKKLVDEHWDDLEREVGKKDRLQLKENIVEEHQNKVLLRIEASKCMKSELKKSGMHKEIERANKNRERIQNINSNIKHHQTEEIKTKASASLAMQQFQRSQAMSSPEIRAGGSIQIKFTSRRLPTPKRESQSHLEEVWFKKQLEAQRAVTGFCEDDLRPEERDPKWLLARGNSFYTDGNYLAAVSAYSTGIQLTPNSYELYLNRAGAQLCLKNYNRAIEDCSTALELLKPKVEANTKARIQCLARRGAALCRLGMLKEGHGEMEAAWKLDQTDDVLRMDLQKIQEEMLEKTDNDEDDE